MNYEITEITDYTDVEFQRIFTAYFNEIGIELKENTDLWNIMKGTKNLHCYAIRNHQQISAFIMFQKECFNSSTNFFLEEAGYIRELYVREKYRKSGIGKLLILEAEKYFRKNAIYKIILTYENNALGFYKKLGFTEDMSYKAKNGQNAVVKNIFK